jgi:hypothetical protein
MSNSIITTMMATHEIDVESIENRPAHSPNHSKLIISRQAKGKDKDKRRSKRKSGKFISTPQRRSSSLTNLDAGISTPQRRPSITVAGLLKLLID